MTETFKRLSQDFAHVDTVQGSALSSNTRDLKSWVNNLPRGNPNETVALLYGGLANSFSEKLTGAMRFNQLEEVRSATVDSIAWLERQCLGKSLPLVSQQLDYAQSALNLHLVLADSYRLASYEFCFPNGSIPILKSTSVNASLERSLWHYQQFLYLSWKLYRPIIKNVWLGIHRVYQFSKLIKLQNKEIEDSIINKSVNIEGLYCELVLLSLMNPIAYTQEEQANLIMLATVFAPQCSIGVNQLTELWVKLPIDSDYPAGCNLQIDEVNYFSVHEISTALEQLNDADDNETFDFILPKFKTLKVATHILVRVKRSLGLTLAREFTRDFSHYSIQTVIGITNIHYFVASRLDFDSFIQQLPQTKLHNNDVPIEWFGRGSDLPVQEPIIAEVLDHSLAGYRIVWKNVHALKIKLGELIGLNLISTEPDWMVGIVRWLQYEQDGSVVAGIELLTRRSHAVALNIYKNIQSTTIVRGLELEPLDEHSPIQFVISGRLQNLNQKIDVIYSNEPNRINISKLIETLGNHSFSSICNMDFSVLTVKVS